MIAHLKPYHDYKDSGVPWLGQVPAHWEVLPGRTVFREINDRGHTDEQMLSVTITRGVLRQADLLADSSKKDSSNEDKSNYKVVQPGDVVYNKMRAWQGAVGVSDYRGIVSPAYIVQRLRSAENLPRYMHFLFRTPFFASEAERWSYGITSDQWSLRADEFKCIYFSIPPLPEQAAIVRFLNYMERRIRRAIRARQQRIKLLEEYKQALIHEAVTGKIDVRTGKPYPAYKNSGVEWLGQVPEHWEMRRLRTVVEMRVSNVDKHSREDEHPVRLCNYIEVYKHEKIRSDMKFMEATASREEIARFRLQTGDVLITKDSEIWNDIAVPALVETSAPDLISGYHLALLRPKQLVLGVFLFRAIQNPQIAYQFHVEAKGVTRFGLSHGAIKSSLILLPPLPEQTAIVEYLDAQTAKLDAAIAATRRAIELLREYRERLIADVATGKVDVREVAAQLPEEPPENEGMEVFDEEVAIEEAEDEILREESDAEA